jgi:acyl-CoA synthetase (AMP-forming)/AMP-acid ligase II
MRDATPFVPGQGALRGPATRGSEKMAVMTATCAARAAAVPFRSLPELIAGHARARPEATALVLGDEAWSWQHLDAQANRIAASLQRQGLRPGDAVALCASASPCYVAVFIGTLRAGGVAVPLPTSATPAQLAAMALDAQARWVFVDAGTPALGVAWPVDAAVFAIDGIDGRHDAAGVVEPMQHWLAETGAVPQPLAIDPAWPFNIIYSSGTTGMPKGIVQPHAMRWAHVQRAVQSGYDVDTVALIATPLYSNTTLACLVPTLARGGCAVLMPKFDALQYLRLAEAHRATHTMLVPVQYRRLMAHPDFDRFDLRSFRAKLCTSAPFHADLKAEVLRRWPGALTEYYGLTEGGGTCILHAHLHPTKLHTVGQPAEGHDIRLIDEDGRELPPGSTGEVVGRSPGMMTGYHRQPELTRAVEWFDAQGRRYLRTGDIARFDDDGFLVLIDRCKDMIISGGFNIYPSDLEAVLRQHPGVADVAVIGVPSAEWGETPVAFVVPREAQGGDADALRRWANMQVGKTQRLHAVRLVDELPRSAIGKVLKRELREAWGG